MHPEPSEPSVFDQLLQAAAAQPQPQQLLYVFCESELPEGATAAQRARHAAGEGGALTPLACYEQPAREAASFEALVAQSRQACPPWQAVFIAALSGQDGEPPAPERVDQALKQMVGRIQQGQLDGLLALDPRGRQLAFS